MKRMILILAILATVGCTVSISYASETDRMHIVKSGEIFKVIYKGEDLATVQVVISDLEGNKIFSEELISIHGFIRPYNFSQLPKGDYMICLTDNQGKKTEKICYRETADNEKVAKKWVAHLSRLNSDEKKIMVIVPHQEPNDFTIKIYNHDDDLVYSENHAASKDFAKVFRLQGFENGAVVHITNNSSGETKIFRAD